MQARRKQRGGVSALIVAPQGGIGDRALAAMRRDAPWAETARKERFDDGLTAALAGTQDVILVAAEFDGRSGLDLLAEARLGGSPTPFILLTERAGDEAVAALETGAADCVDTTEIEAGALGRRVRYAVVSARLLREAEDSNRRLRALNERATRLLERASPLLLVDTRGVVRFANGAAEHLLGVGLVGRPAPVPSLLGGAADVEIEADGKRRVIHLQAEPLVWNETAATAVRLTDVTEMRTARTAVDRLRPMATAGQLATGVTHDLGNYLQVIFGALEELRELDGLDSAAHSALEPTPAPDRALTLTTC